LAKESATCVLLKEQVVKILGKHTNVFRYADGLEGYGWNLKKENAILWAYFDKDGRVKKITAELN
jgi:outer membrane protein assembly factor BamE (lipoprotein component of BamABCDE complex)